MLLRMINWKILQYFSILEAFDNTDGYEYNQSIQWLMQH